MTFARDAGQRNPMVRPVVKWVGGKRQLLSKIAPLIPRDDGRYFEPFVGGGAVLFATQPHRAVVNDANSGLIEVYEVLRDDLRGLLAELREHVNTAEHYYSVRDWDRDPKAFAAMSPARRAARFIYLNKTCYNGLYRVNASGLFNTPFGHYAKPAIVDEPPSRRYMSTSAAPKRN
ncbi:MAG: Dam family site-specific DNA-(adenine-N6)-methyltransferase [Demequina sp.]|nr:Dam family site-specific DNA-(adenine-N6)-methyltransferase [Demequina sp.]